MTDEQDNEHKRTRLDPAARRELAASVRFLSQLHYDATGKRPKPHELVETLRERGQHAQADELERMVVKARAKRERDQ